MAVKPQAKPQARAGGARSVKATEFKLWCDIDGYIVSIEPKTGQPIKGKCAGLSTATDAGGVRITEVVMETEDFAPCTWKKIGGVWQCV